MKRVCTCLLIAFALLFAGQASTQADRLSGSASAASSMKAECEQLKKQLGEERARFERQQKEELGRCQRSNFSNPKECGGLQEQQRKALQALREHQDARLAHCAEDSKVRETGRNAGKKESTTGPLTTSGRNLNAITVPASTRWVDTGVMVQQGQRVSFQASGRITLSAGPNDAAEPAGSLTQRYAVRAPIPRSLAGALIAHVDNGEPFGIGNLTNLLTMPASGRLFLGVNDDDLADNRGEFTVVIRNDQGQVLTRR